MQAMKHKGIIVDYAVFGAVAQMRYTEPVATLDADILIVLPQNAGLDALRPIYQYCDSMGYRPEGEAIRVGQWPVQFIPVFSPLTAEAVQEAETGDLEGIPLRVISAVHLAAIALSVGRPKDLLRIHSLLDAQAVTIESLEVLALRHGLSSQWKQFKNKFLHD